VVYRRRRTHDATVTWPSAANSIAGAHMLEALRQPRWMVGAVVALITIVTFVSLGFWQLRRHEERRDFNAAAVVALNAPELAIGDVDGTNSEAFEYRSVRVAGSFVPGATAVLQLQLYRGRAGFHAIGALELADGTAVVINRGWFGLDDPRPPPPSGSMDLVGRLRLFRSDGTVTDSGPPIRVSSLDVELLQREWELELAPFYLEAVAPEATELPMPVDEPEITDGPHISYAGQWFAFAAIVVIGFPLLLRKASKRA